MVVEYVGTYADFAAISTDSKLPLQSTFFQIANTVLVKFIENCLPSCPLSPHLLSPHLLSPHLLSPHLLSPHLLPPPHFSLPFLPSPLPSWQPEVSLELNWLCIGHTHNTNGGKGKWI